MIVKNSVVASFMAHMVYKLQDWLQKQWKWPAYYILHYSDNTCATTTAAVAAAAHVTAVVADAVAAAVGAAALRGGDKSGVQIRSDEASG